MPGLLKNGDPRDSGMHPDDETMEMQGSPNGQDPDAAMEGQEEQPNVSPEEQAQYDEFVNNALNLVYDEKAFPSVLKRLAGNGNPIDGLAATTVMVVDRLEDSAKKANAPVSPDVLLHGGKEILEDLANLAEKAGIHTFTPEEAESALYKAMDLYREIRAKEGTLDTQAATEDFNQVVEADKAGQLEELAPGLAEHFAAGGGAGAQPGQEQPQPGPSQPASRG